MKPSIVIPEYNNPKVQKALQLLDEDIEIISGDNLENSLKMLMQGVADGIITGLDYTTRDVIIACRDVIGTVDKTFSSCVYFKKTGAEPFILADPGVTKNPDADRLTDIVLQTYKTAQKLLSDEPRIAMLSFSTAGSAKDDSIEKIRQVIKNVREKRPEIKIDGEMQLDAAINPRVAARKMPSSEAVRELGLKDTDAKMPAPEIVDAEVLSPAVAGRANVLITPDLNSGNILYKSIEQFGGFSAAGPILQGFKKPVSDLSRGSTAEDIALTITQLAKLL